MKKSLLLFAGLVLALVSYVNNSKIQETHQGDGLVYDYSAPAPSDTTVSFFDGIQFLAIKTDDGIILKNYVQEWFFPKSCLIKTNPNWIAVVYSEDAQMYYPAEVIPLADDDLSEGYLCKSLVKSNAYKTNISKETEIKPFERLFPTGSYFYLLDKIPKTMRNHCICTGRYI